MQKIKIYLIGLVFVVMPAIGQAAELDGLKADFLQGNYRRVIFEGQGQVGSRNIQGADELNYLLGLSYLKEANLTLAQDCFQRILENASSKFRVEATLGLADTYLMVGQFQDADNIYRKLIEDNPNISLKAAILYRLSQSGFKQGNNSEGNEYLLKLKKDFPLSSELKLTRGIPQVKSVAQGRDVYSVQVGFFSNRENANNFKAKLLIKGYPAYVEESSGGCRVRVGRFKTEREALDLGSKLSQEGFSIKICP